MIILKICKWHIFASFQRAKLAPFAITRTCFVIPNQFLIYWIIYHHIIIVILGIFLNVIKFLGLFLMAGWENWEWFMWSFTWRYDGKWPPSERLSLKIGEKIKVICAQQFISEIVSSSCSFCFQLLLNHIIFDLKCFMDNIFDCWA